MEHFASTDTLMEMLEDGRYKRLVEADDPEAAAPNDFFEEVFDNYKKLRKDRYAFLDRRKPEYQIDDDELETNRGTIVSTGFKSVPLLVGNVLSYLQIHWVITEKKDKHGGFVSSCIELQMDGYGNDAADAQKDMLSNVEYYLKANFTECKDHCWSNLANLICDRGSSSRELWEKYNLFQLIQAERRAENELRKMQERT
jgi:hypothetical protein